MNRLAQERLALETALRKALKSGGLRLHYQPQIEMATGRLYGVEALARWTHAELGEISPPALSRWPKSGLIADLGSWALEEACRQLSQWRAKGKSPQCRSICRHRAFTTWICHG
jgi:EAL domain-containing protein (putative c-di-GMP-specific phosphodiesterase class I)